MPNLVDEYIGDSVVGGGGEGHSDIHVVLQTPKNITENYQLEADHNGLLLAPVQTDPGVELTVPEGSTLFTLGDVGGGGGGGSAHTIQDEGVSLPQRNIMNFTGAGVAVTDAGGKTVVTIAGGGGGGGTGNVVFFDPNIVATTGNRYKTFPELVAAVNSNDAPVVDVYVHIPGSTQLAILDAGTYDLSKFNIRGSGQSIYPVLVCGDGVQFTSLPNKIENVIFYMFQKTDVPLFTLTGPLDKYIFCDYGIFIRQTSTPPMFFLSGDFDLEFKVQNAAYDYDFISHSPKSSPPPTPLIHIDDSSSRIAVYYGAGEYDVSDIYLATQSDVFSGAGDVTIGFDVKPLPDFPSSTHSSLTGNFNLDFVPRDFLEVNKTYGERFKYAELCSTTDINILTLDNLTSIDGLGVSGDYSIVLLAGQTDPIENGLYAVFYNGPAKRLSTFITTEEVAGAIISIARGNSNAGKLFQVVSQTIDIDVQPLLFKEVRIPKVTPTNITGTGAVDLRLADIYHVDPAAATTITLNNFQIGGRYEFIIRQGITPYLVDFSSTPTIKWPGGVPFAYTNSANAIDKVIITYDGTNLLGDYEQAYS